jgi:hypothetical protein
MTFGDYVDPNEAWSTPRAAAIGATVLGQRPARFMMLNRLVLAALVFVMAVMLTWLNGVYGELIGCPRPEPRATWLRSMRAEGEDTSGHTVAVTALERIVMIDVYIAVITLVIWYVVFAGAPSPILCTRCF